MLISHPKPDNKAGHERAVGYQSRHDTRHDKITDPHIVTVTNNTDIVPVTNTDMVPVTNTDITSIPNSYLC